MTTSDIHSDIHSDTAGTDPKAEAGECCGSCSSTETATTAAAGVSEQPEESHAVTTTTYAVAGMTCGHCVSAVSAEIGKLTGVSDVQVDLPTGAVTVTGATLLPQDQVTAAVEEAGYELTEHATGAGTGTEGERAG